MLAMDLEAAIGIEPMNKGFAVYARLFAQDRDCTRACSFTDLFDFLSLHVIAQNRACCDW
jgi:hypothetical protein